MNLKWKGGQAHYKKTPLLAQVDMFAGDMEFYVVGMQHGEACGYAVSVYAPLDTNSMLCRSYEDALKALQTLQQDPLIAEKGLEIYKMHIMMEKAD